MPLKSIVVQIPYNPIKTDWPSPSMTTILAYHLICHSIAQFKCIFWYFTIEILFNMFNNATETQSIYITLTKPKHQTFVSCKKNPHPKHIRLTHIIHHPLWSNNSIYHIICFFSKLHGDKEKLSTFISLTHRSDACVQYNKVWVFKTRFSIRGAQGF